MQRKRRAVRECEELLWIIEELTLSRERFMKPSAKSLGGFASDIPSIKSFLEGINGGSSLISAYLKAEEGLSIREGEKKLLRDAFSALGKGYLDDDIGELKRAKEALSDSLSDMRCRLEGEERLSGAVSAAISVGLVLFFL